MHSNCLQNEIKCNSSEHAEISAGRYFEKFKIPQSKGASPKIAPSYATIWVKLCTSFKLNQSLNSAICWTFQDRVVKRWVSAAITHIVSTDCIIPDNSLLDFKLCACLPVIYCILFEFLFHSTETQPGNNLITFHDICKLV